MKWGNAGLGSINQLTGSLMLEKLGLKGNSVPYDGGRSAAIKVVAGEVTWSWCGLSDILDLAQSGDIRISGHLRQQPPGDRLCKGELYRTQPSGRLPRVERSSGIAVLGLPGFPRYTGRRRGKDPRRIPEYCGQQRVGAVLPDQRAGACGNNRHRERRNMCKAGIHLCMGVCMTPGSLQSTRPITRSQGSRISRSQPMTARLRRRHGRNRRAHYG